MLHFCSYFDSHYLPRALALYHSLEEHCPSFTLWGLSMDKPSYDFLSQMAAPRFRPIRLQEFERGDHALLGAKANRNTVEYYFTCTPSLPLFLLDRHPEIDRITYLDADLFCFSNPSALFSEIEDYSISIVPHRFHPRLRRLEKRGLYNVGFLSFRRDENAFSCLKVWRQQCIEWCYDREEDGRYADQKYLDSWSSCFDSVMILENKGVNVGPWNLSNYEISYDGNIVRMDSEPLIFFHFHGLREITPWLYEPNLTVFRGKLTRAAREWIYAPYIQTLGRVKQDLSHHLSKRSLSSGIRGIEKRKLIPLRIWSLLDRMVYIFLLLLKRNFILIPRKESFRHG